MSLWRADEVRTAALVGAAPLGLAQPLQGAVGKSPITLPMIVTASFCVAVRIVLGQRLRRERV